MDKALFMLFDFGLTMFFILLIVFVGVFGVHVNQMNTFEDQAQSVISRSGGFNQNVEDTLNQQADDYYRSGASSSVDMVMFHVRPIDYDTNHENTTKNVSGQTNSTVKKYASVPYGQPIKYRVTAQIPFVPIIDKGHVSLIFNLSPDSDFAKNGNGERQEVDSEVRQGSQDNPIHMFN